MSLDIDKRGTSGTERAGKERFSAKGRQSNWKKIRGSTTRDPEKMSSREFNRADETGKSKLISQTRTCGFREEGGAIDQPVNNDKIRREEF